MDKIGMRFKGRLVFSTKRWFLWLLMVACALPAWAAPPPKVSCLGQIVAGERTFVLSAPEGSVLGQLLVKRGDRVARGAELARLRDFDTQAAAVESAKKEITLARAGLTLIERGKRPEEVEAQRAVVAAREASLNLHQAKKERYRQLHEKSIVPDDAYEAIAYDYEAARADFMREKNLLTGMLSGRAEEIRQAAAQVDVALANLRLEQARLEAQRIRAPIAGKVLAIKAYPGEAISEAGILDLADTDNMMILAEVYETDIARVQIGSRARISSTVFAGEMGGKVVEVERQVQAGRVYALDPRRHADRRIVLVRIKPDHPARLVSYTHAQVTVILNAQ